MVWALQPDWVGVIVKTRTHLHLSLDKCLRSLGRADPHSLPWATDVPLLPVISLGANRTTTYALRRIRGQARHPTHLGHPVHFHGVIRLQPYWKWTSLVSWMKTGITILPIMDTPPREFPPCLLPLRHPGITIPDSRVAGIRGPPILWRLYLTGCRQCRDPMFPKGYRGQHRSRR